MSGNGIIEFNKGCAICGQSSQFGLLAFQGEITPLVKICEFCAKALLRSSRLVGPNADPRSHCAFCGEPHDPERPNLWEGPRGIRLCLDCAEALSASSSRMSPSPLCLMNWAGREVPPESWFGALPPDRRRRGESRETFDCQVCGHRNEDFPEDPLSRVSRVALPDHRLFSVCAHCLQTGLEILQRVQPAPRRAGSSCAVCGDGEREGKPLLTFPGEPDDGQGRLTFCPDCLAALSAKLGEPPKRGELASFSLVKIPREGGPPLRARVFTPFAPPEKTRAFLRELNRQTIHVTLKVGNAEDSSQEPAVPCAFCGDPTVGVRPSAYFRDQVHSVNARVCAGCAARLVERPPQPEPTRSEGKGARCSLCEKPETVERPLAYGLFPTRTRLCLPCLRKLNAAILVQSEIAANEREGAPLAREAEGPALAPPNGQDPPGPAPTPRPDAPGGEPPPGAT